MTDLSNIWVQGSALRDRCRLKGALPPAPRAVDALTKGLWENRGIPSWGEDKRWERLPSAARWHHGKGSMTTQQSLRSATSSTRQLQCHVCRGKTKIWSDPFSVSFGCCSENRPGSEPQFHRPTTRGFSGSDIATMMAFARSIPFLLLLLLSRAVSMSTIYWDTLIEC